MFSALIVAIEIIGTIESTLEAVAEGKHPLDCGARFLRHSVGVNWLIQARHGFQAWSTPLADSCASRQKNILGWVVWETYEETMRR